MYSLGHSAFSALGEQQDIFFGFSAPSFPNYRLILIPRFIEDAFILFPRGLGNVKA